MEKNILWITWETHTRTRSIAKSLDVKLVEMSAQGDFPLRHIQLAFKTLHHLIHARPDILFIQNPSLVLSLLAVILRLFFRYKLIVDAHNEAIQPYLHQTKIIKWISNLIIRYSHLTIVTNKHLAHLVSSAAGNAFVLPDKIPEPTINKSFTKDLKSELFKLTLIATYAKDEPVENIFSAVANYEDKLVLYVTGNKNKLEKTYRKSLSKNIIFTGFLDEKDYWQQLKTSDAVIDLSLMDNCLVCGAYESVAVSTPMILSDNLACKAYFNKGTIHTDSSIVEINQALNTMISNHKRLKEEVKVLKIELEKNWQILCNNLNDLLDRM